MNLSVRWMTWLAAMCLAVALVSPAAVVADDDDDWEDDGEYQVDDASDDDDWEPAPAAPVSDDDDDDAQPDVAPPANDDDWDDDSSDDMDDDDDLDEPEDADDDDEDDGLDVAVPNEVIVQLQPGADAASFAARYGASVDRVIPTSNIVLVQLDPDMDDQSELNDILLDDDVVWGEFNFTNQAPEGRPRYFFTSTVATSGPAEAPALPEGLEFTPESACVTGTGVVVAVLDTGVDVHHPQLAFNVLPGGLNTVDNSFDVADAGDGIDDDNDGQIDELVGHGTHVAGIVVQVAPDARILPVKVLNSDGVGDSFSVTSGIHYAVEQGADVINLSLGSTYDSVAIRSAVDFAHGEGVVVVAAAGNANQHLPVEYPAGVESVISVAATDATADKASYSNWHETVDLSAPGDNVASASPDGQYVTASGTSMSTPLVAGSAALMLERQPEATPDRVLSVLNGAAGPLSLADPTLAGMMGGGELDIDASISCNG